jgi:hypothetical protein
MFDVPIFCIGTILAIPLALVVLVPLLLPLGWANTIALYVETQQLKPVSTFKLQLIFVSLLVLVVGPILVSKGDSVFHPLWFCAGLIALGSLIVFPISTLHQKMLFVALNLLSVVVLGTLHFVQTFPYLGSNISIFSAPLNILISGAFAVVSMQ